MAVLDPLATTDRIGESYRRYLLSTYGPRRTDLFEEYRRALDEGINVTKGPILQATAPFESGATIGELMREGVLSPQFDRVAQVLPLDRPLHVHQEVAVRKAVSDGRNLVVSTGTGSGKTEAFLIPILQHLFTEQEAGTLGRAGVRALLLYPMNALANDQLKRLRELLTAVPEITFGRYTGETKHDTEEAEDDFRQRYPSATRLSNELVSRNAMQAMPPHLLLTNYAMLEYLLLRPADTTFFDGETARHWSHLVLDEAHVYNGAKGTEVAMLLRRLATGSSPASGRLQCFATSATLGRGVEDHPDLVAFAEALFDEPFEWTDQPSRQDVVIAQRRPLQAVPAAGHVLSADTIRALHSAFRSGAASAELGAVDGIEEVAVGGEEAGHYLYRLLHDEQRVLDLQRILGSDSSDLDDVARQLWPDRDDAAELVVLLTDLCVNARSGEHDAPLLPARYHFFVRSLEGAYLCLHPSHPEDRRRIRLQPEVVCPDCEDTGVESQMFELGVCRHCHAEYLVGREESPSPNAVRLTPASSFEERLTYFLLDASATDVDTDDLAETEIGDETAGGLELCPGCGTATLGGDPCECSSRVARIPVTLLRPARSLDDDEQRRRASERLHRCASCGERAKGEVVFRSLTGTDAPVAVVATDLYQQIPPSANEGAQLQVGQGRKLLAFSDSRQDAAFFAPFVERTYGRALQRSLILDAVRSSKVPLRTDDLIEIVMSSALKHLVLDPDDGRTASRREVAYWVTEELLALDRRQSLEGVGLVRIAVARPRAYQGAPAGLTRLGLTEDESDSLLQLILSTLRNQAVVAVPEGVDIRQDRFSPRNQELVIRGTGAERGVFAFVPNKRAKNRRQDLLTKVFARRGLEAEPVEVLEGLWQYLTDPGGPWAKTLVDATTSKTGAAWRLGSEKFEFEADGPGVPSWMCDTCGRLGWWNVADVCSAWRCEGSLRSLTESEERNHYAALYQRLSPIAMSAQEHTAQWTARQASLIQDEFVGGDVNLLSCSTTFEMGVDVGDVQTVLLRNVPPGPENYVQRAGRAGRRTDAAALVVTYAQRRNHDRAYFDHPEAMVDGYIQPPRILLDNLPIARRHAHSVAFAAFLRNIVDAGGDEPRAVGEFFVAGEPTLSSRFTTWLRSHPAPVRDALGRLLPAALLSEIGIEDWSWVESLLGETKDLSTGWYARAESEVHYELEKLGELQKDALISETGWLADRYKRVAETLRRRQLLGFLATKNVLPKYGFPVDVVELNLGRSGSAVASRVELNRDLTIAIREFAPGNQVVAAKTVWESVGLAGRPDQELPLYKWAECAECGAFRRGLSLPESCPVCESSTYRRSGSFLVPLFGFLGDEAGQAGDTRPLRSGSVQTYFTPGADEPMIQMDGLAGVRSRMSRHGSVTVINTGLRAGFGICEWCRGIGKLTGPKGGKTPHRDPRKPQGSGAQCDGPVNFRGIGHEYLTDVVEIDISFPMTPEVAQSTLYALIEGARSLGIGRDEIDGTTYVHSSQGSPGLVIFDTVPGGAGHARRFASALPDVARAARAKVSECDCGEETSCYGCLRSYSNQPLHDRLSRGAAGSLLESMLA